ncbi:MAG: hypothetical protein OQK09_11430 [Colwellia sp.]|nr:hypothetical protein [Colwellia sp.]MCW8865848.1 hypothetical protein [Colwellia sp.]MCW9082114.1 hypothetical protein [Colwellia sp.]
MTIASVSSAHPMAFQLSYGANPQQHNHTLLSQDSHTNEIVLSEQDRVNAMLAEQKINIESNFQSAINIDLTRLYYQQQQNVIDAYIQVYNDDNVKNKSASSLLNDAYVSLYAIHQAVKHGVPQWHNLDNNEFKQLLPENSPNHSPHAQIDEYNSIMMPSNATHINLSA